MNTNAVANGINLWHVCFTQVAKWVLAVSRGFKTSSSSSSSLSLSLSLNKTPTPYTKKRKENSPSKQTLIAHDPPSLLSLTSPSPCFTHEQTLLNYTLNDQQYTAKTTTKSAMSAAAATAPNPSSSSTGGGGNSSGGGGGSGSSSSGPTGPCGACKFLRRKCITGCIFAPYFDADQGATHFAAVHKVFGASNVSKLLHQIPIHKRLDAVVTICYEAQARLRDPVYGCVAHIFALQQQVNRTHLL